MGELLAAYAAALALGASHALEVDHMVAVTAFVGGRPRLGPAASFGVRWGLGHAAVVLVVGGALAWSGLAIPVAAAGWAELVVGLVLIGLGAWALRAARRLHVHDPSGHGGHAHLHAHTADMHPHTHKHTDPSRRHRHLATAVGAVHGLAGTAPVAALIPVTLLPGRWAAIGYLAAFGVGTILSMGIYAALTALAVRHAGRSVALARAAARLTAVASLAVGLWWVMRSVETLTP